ncbi:TetR/AcrR family transcriptional regulator [Maricaulaceae bacterium MS644]
MTHHPSDFDCDRGPEDILDCAVALFVEQGFERPSFADIAARADAPESYVRLLFPTKEKMIEGLVELTSARIADAVARLTHAAADRDPEAGLRAIFTLLFKTIADKDLSAATRVVMAEGARFPALASHYRRRVIDIAHAALTDLLEAGARRGVFRQVDADAANRVLIGPAVTELFMTTVFADVGDQERDPTAYAEDIADIIFNGLKA